MSKRRLSKKDREAAGAVLLVIAVAVIWALVAVWEFLMDTGLIWLVPIAIVATVGGRWYLRRRAEKQRVAMISARSAEFGDEMCRWLIMEGVNLRDSRVANIMEHFDKWGLETTQNLIQQRIGVAMTTDMVRLSLGKPTSVDMRETSTRGEKFRYIYGVPRRGAAYIWFRDGRVTKIKQ